MIRFDLIDNHIALLTLNRPEAANAMSRAFLEQLRERLAYIEQQHEIYCVVITGAGDKAFCAGADLKERKGMSEREVIQTVRYIGVILREIERLRVPVIAAINGAAFGGGLELALSCDLRIASTTAKLGLTETSLAIIPGAGGTQRLPRLIGIGQAKRLIYTAKPISAQEALSIGLVEQVVEPSILLHEAVSLARIIATNGPVALQQAKIAINNGIETDLMTGLTIEHLAYRETIPTEDRLEGLRAFGEKRKPDYQGK